LEKLVSATMDVRVLEADDPTVSGQIEAKVREIASQDAARFALEKCLAEIQTKIPDARREELFARLRDTALARATEIAFSLVAEDEASGAPD